MHPLAGVLLECTSSGLVRSYELGRHIIKGSVFTLPPRMWWRFISVSLYMSPYSENATVPWGEVFLDKFPLIVSQWFLHGVRVRNSLQHGFIESALFLFLFLRIDGVFSWAIGRPPVFSLTPTSVAFLYVFPNAPKVSNGTVGYPERC